MKRTLGQEQMSHLRRQNKLHFVRKTIGQGKKQWKKLVYMGKVLVVVGIENQIDRQQNMERKISIV